MASLINTKIQDTYTGLIKTADNLPVDGTLKNLEDGNGGVLPMQVSTTGVNFTGTVTGLPVADAGLINGVGADSLISSPDLTTTPATAPLSGQIAIGNGATTGAYIVNSIAIGNNAVGGGGTAVGNGAEAFSAGRSAAYGANAKSLGNESVAIGGDSYVPSNSAGGVALGDSATVGANAPNAVAIGNDVTASTANTVSVKALEVQTDSTPTAGGIIMSDAGGVDRRINIDATGALQIDSTPVGGGGGAAGLVSGAAADSMISDASLTTNPASALCVRGIALGDNARAATYANQVDGIAIGTDALSEATNSIAIGKGAWGQSGDEIAIGTSAHSRLGDGIAIGRSAYAGNTGNIALGKLANCDYQYTGAMALGTDTVVAANGGVALGASVTADKVDTVSMKALDLQTASTPTTGGIIMTDAGSTERRLNITAAGALQIDSTPVGGGAAGLENGAGTSSLQSAASLTATAANASGNQSIAIGDAAIANSIQATAIGKGCEATALEATAIGNDSDARQDYDLAVGRSCVANGNSATAIGANSSATATGAVALGSSVTAATANTVTIKKLQMLDYATLDYADDTAAAAGGIPLGGVYHTSGALKIRIA